MTAAQTDTGGHWIGAHLFHFGDLDPLITDVVDPVTRELAADGTAGRSFFLRYWEGGQHVRLRLEVPDPARAPRVRDLVRERAAAHFATHPSPSVDAAAYRAFASAMAAGERRTSYDDRLHPAGSVAFLGYRPEYEAYGDAACVAAAERHFAVSSRLALDVLRARTEMGRRAAIGLAALTAAAAVCEPDLPTAAHRLAAAARDAQETRNGKVNKGHDAQEARNGAASTDDRTRHDAPKGENSAASKDDLPRHVTRKAENSAASEDDWRRREGAVLAQTRRLWDAPDSGGDLLAAWAASLRALRDDLDLLHAAGRCAPLDSGSPHASLALVAPPERRTVSLILMRCVHLFHNRLGLRAGTERHVSYLAARGIAGLADSRR
ncbi:lantibiotic dehydratase C-terminal domain-containing protein [Nonomuraea jiangxiensis]|uniref:Lantibiotic biosynthesis dehydratase C-term n=1 Tax=Nonomuraea jiangxiensis TaxID=633440 RepID=A0A1G9P1W2_9ACTN|nr:lantibiotic dehydratase C-terminal domain-containing protein [Nonomuraea jiangxiensis]SDL92788.1 Lantibiotic biosynthesis dehydratase C-term [Nonomuraea jiangxiensis]